MMKFLQRVVFLAMVVPFVAVADEILADAIYLNGNIYTVDSSFSKASSIAVLGDKIVFVGDNDDALEYRTESTAVVDLEGRTVIPGIIESHLHYLWIGETLDRIDIFNQPKAVILERVKAEAERLGDGRWIIAAGWNNVLWGEDFPTKEELDAVAPNNYVALTRVDYHSVWFNSLALEYGGITTSTPDPAGGEIKKKADGSIWGVLIDTAADLIVVPDDTSDDEKLDRFSLADKSIVSNGITTLVDAGIPHSQLEILDRGYQSGRLKVRAYEMLSEGEEVGRSPFEDRYNGKLSARAVKIYSDGSLGSRSAWLLQDYTDQAGHTGNGRWNDQQLTDIVDRVNKAGFQACTHAIGDAAVHQAINAYVDAVGETNLKTRRFRIEHFQIVDPADIPRAHQLGIIPSMQATHATSDMNMAEDRIGTTRIQTAYAWATILNQQGAIIADGSDAPVELVNPFHGIYAAVARKARGGEPPEAWHPNESMTREQALRSFTIWGAYARFAENTTGSLEVGKYADFVVLDRDIINCPESEIKDILPLKTVIGGEVVFENGTGSHSKINTIKWSFYLFFILFFFKTLTF